ncbi:uncharacterized protein LOC113755144 [Coffea eugenioides]|uniref:uncharacterized protein LOC113755144 n=1 Tax=Coffea eugenioides TaxID=49369 RepID=UPI000F609CDE|nr:uncharacterized protein LOC113755144 [Coffea eugenioides]
MVPYESLFGRKRRFPIHWDEIGEKKILNPTTVPWIEKAFEKVKLIHQRIRMAQSRQKSYADNRRKDLKLEIGDKMFLKITPLKASLMAEKRKNLQQRFVGLYKVIQHVGNVAYKLELPLNLSRIHNVFHVSILRKYHSDPSHMLQPKEVKIDENLSYEEKSVKLLDRKVKELKHKQIPLVKVLWRNHGIEEATWEVEEEIRKKYQELFINQIREAIYRRAAIGDPVCKGCGEEQETIEHTLLQCPLAQEIWKVAPLIWDGAKDQIGNFQRW